MGKILTVTLLAISSIGIAAAQVTETFLGAWKVTWQRPAQAYEARLVITGTGGTWKTSAWRKNNPCIGLEVPVKVESVSERELTLTLQFAEVISGCQNVQISLSVGPGNVMTGRRDNAELTLVRER